MPDTRIIETKDLTCIYDGSHNGVFDINLCVSKGEFIIVAGKNGSGKTTLFRLFNALLTPSSGKVLIHGKDSVKHPVFARRTTGMVFQDADMQIVGETVYDDTAFGPENLKLPRKEINHRVETALKKIGLFHLKDRNPSTLSGGEKRRLALAGVLSMDPEVIVFDEPFANLDYPGSLDLLSCIRDIHASGQTIIIAIHDIEKVISFATRMIIMDNGKIVHDNIPAALLDKLKRYGIRQPASNGIVPWL